MRTGPLAIKARLMCGDEFAMGPGKADLLDAIAKFGSISAAGRDLGMSYRRAWLLVDAMNRCWTDKLVETTAGGAKERGARLTDSGRQVLSHYRAMEQAMADAAAPQVAAIRALLRTEPDTPKTTARRTA
jgi:molybdate transport system regulatory protein